MIARRMGCANDVSRIDNIHDYAGNRRHPPGRLMPAANDVITMPGDKRIKCILSLT
jgi:hypothetical protein